MRFGTRHFVCDTCGSYRSSMYPVTRCRVCGSREIARFTGVIAALEHGAHVKERRRNRKAWENLFVAAGGVLPPKERKK